jgi:hypothetical protein
MAAPMRDAVTGISDVYAAIIFFTALLIVVVAILTALYILVRDKPPQSPGQSYRRHRPWNFK